MTREEAIIVLNDVIKLRTDAYITSLTHGGKQDHGEEDFLDAMYSALDALREQPRWISVEERLPEDDVEVLTRRATGMSVETHCGFGWDYDEYNGNWRVTHWMPLPEGPEVEV